MQTFALSKQSRCSYFVFSCINLVFVVIRKAVELIFLFPMLSLFDYLIIGGAVITLLAIAGVTGREENDTQDFFLGKRKIPAWAACLSFLATEISAMTIVGVPATGFRENWQFLQFFIGSAVARVVVAYLFIPAFYKFNCTTIYEFLRHRFGPETQYAGSVFFFITRLIASGVRLYAASLAVSVIMGWSLPKTILLFSVVSTAFIAFGGIKAIIWTGTFEAISFYAAGLGVGAYLLLHIQGGVGEVMRVAGEAGRLSVFNFSSAAGDPNVLWLAVLNGIFGSLAAFGTDQELMQRLLTVETRKNSQRAMLSTIAAIIPLNVIYLAVGTLLFVFYRQNPLLPLPDNTDKILPYFVSHVLPSGLRGLMLAAIILASVDSPLGSLTSSFVTDIYRTIIRPGRDERHYLGISRLSVVCFAAALAFIAWSCRSFEGMLWFAYQINGVTAGSLLGVFLLGLLTRCKSNRENVFAMVLSSALMLTLLVLSKTGMINLAWSWLIVLGTTGTFALSWLLSLFSREKQ